MIAWLEHSSFAVGKMTIIDIVDEFSLAISLRIENGNYFVSAYQFFIKKFFNQNLVIWSIFRYFSQLVPFIKNWNWSNDSSIKFPNEAIKEAIWAEHLAVLKTWNLWRQIEVFILIYFYIQMKRVIEDASSWLKLNPNHYVFSV